MRNHLSTISNACPTFFRAACAEAAVNRQFGYRNAGWHLARHLGTLIDYDPETKIAELWDLLPGQDAIDRDGTVTPLSDHSDRKVWNWFKRELPRCMELVPSRRKAQFLRGVYQLHKERGVSA